MSDMNQEVPSGSIEIHPGNRPGELRVYFRNPKGVLHRLSQSEVNKILSEMDSHLEAYHAEGPDPLKRIMQKVLIIVVFLLLLKLVTLLDLNVY
jgi:hypothetical protein